jgi:hypothetical protein
MAVQRLTPTTTVSYGLEKLFSDQDRDWVVDTIAPVLAWVPGKSIARKTQPFRFIVQQLAAGVATAVAIDLVWDEATLSGQVPGVLDHAERLRTGKSAQREHVTELAAYGLTFVAISSLMPGRRVVHMNKGVAPDILLDLTPTALKGVETAGRATGGKKALSRVRDGTGGTQGKAPQLLARADLAEVHLALWCASPRVSLLERLKP